MPLYEYTCNQCSQQIELLVRSSETPECPHCQSQKLTRLLSVPAGHVAGGGLNVYDTPRPMPCGMGGCGLPECRR